MQTIDKIVIARGIAMPFFPMRPATGRVLRNKGNVEEFYSQVLRRNDWIVHPKLSGDRACIGILDGTVHIQNRHGGWYGHPVKNLEDFKKLPDRTVLDGEVFKGNFYPFDCLAVGGQSFLLEGVERREKRAFDIVQQLGHEWKFSRPTKAWVANLHANEPEYDGVVLKRAESQYIMLGSPSQASLDWLKRVWGLSA